MMGTEDPIFKKTTLPLDCEKTGTFADFYDGNRGDPIHEIQLLKHLLEYADLSDKI